MSKNFKIQTNSSSITADLLADSFTSHLNKEAVQPRRVDESIFNQINSIMNGKSKFPSVAAAVKDMQERSGLTAYLDKTSKNNEVKKTASTDFYGDFSDKFMKDYSEQSFEDSPVDISEESVNFTPGEKSTSPTTINDDKMRSFQDGLNAAESFDHRRNVIQALKLWEVKHQLKIPTHSLIEFLEGFATGADLSEQEQNIQAEALTKLKHLRMNTVEDWSRAQEKNKQLGVKDKYLYLSEEAVAHNEAAKILNKKNKAEKLKLIHDLKKDSQDELGKDLEKMTIDELLDLAMKKGYPSRNRLTNEEKKNLVSKANANPRVIEQAPQILKTIENIVKSNSGFAPIQAIISRAKAIHKNDISDDSSWDDPALKILIAQLNLEAKSNNTSTYQTYNNLGTYEHNTDVDPSNIDAYKGLEPVRILKIKDHERLLLN